jgi:hypothetical protein
MDTTTRDAVGRSPAFSVVFEILSFTMKIQEVGESVMNKSSESKRFFSGGSLPGWRGLWLWVSQLPISTIVFIVVLLRCELGRLHLCDVASSERDHPRDRASSLPSHRRVEPGTALPAPSGSDPS